MSDIKVFAIFSLGLDFIFNSTKNRVSQDKAFFLFRLAKIYA